MVFRRLAVLFVFQFILFSCGGGDRSLDSEPAQSYSQKKRTFSSNGGDDDEGNVDTLPIIALTSAPLCGMRSLSPPLDDQIPSEYSVIKTPEQFQNIRNDLNKKYVLGADLDLSGFEFQTIGYFNTFFDSSCFAGILDGNGYEIRNLKINEPQKKSVALFGCVTGEIKNLRLRDIDVRGDSMVAALVGQHFGSIDNVHYSRSADFAGLVQGNTRVGGLVGQMQGAASITNSTANVVVSGASQVGGLAGSLLYGPFGYVSGRISGSYAKAMVTASSSDSSAGGLVGSVLLGTIESSCAEATVTGGNQVGGLVGDIMSFNPSVEGAPTALISRSISKSRVIGKSKVGGLVGSLVANSRIEDSYSHSTVGVEQDSGGGLVGSMSVSAAVAGLAGIKNAYALTSFDNHPMATALGSFVGMISLQGSSDYSFVKASFVRNGDSTWTVGGRIGEFAKAEIQDLSDADLRAPSIFKSAGWSENFWKLRTGVYPLLVSENP